jgi:ketosteroid isomerase-like protein
VSSENVEIAKTGFDAFAKEGVEGLMAFIHPEFEASTPPQLASEPDTYRGHDGVRRYFDPFYEVMEDIRWEADEFIAVGELVVVPFTLRAKGKSTGLDFGQPAVQVWEFRDGLAIRMELYARREEGLAAARERAGEGG